MVRVVRIPPPYDLAGRFLQELLKISNPNARHGEEEDVSWHRSPAVMDRPLGLVARRASVPPISPQSFRRTMENLERAAIPS